MDIAVNSRLVPRSTDDEAFQAQHIQIPLVSTSSEGSIVSCGQKQIFLIEDQMRSIQAAVALVRSQISAGRLQCQYETVVQSPKSATSGVASLESNPSTEHEQA